MVLIFFFFLNTDLIEVIISGAGFAALFFWTIQTDICGQKEGVCQFF